MIALSHIIENYRDRDLLLVAADQYHDADRPDLEAAFRWFARHRKAPYCTLLPGFASPLYYVWFNPSYAYTSYQQIRQWLRETSPITCHIPVILSHDGLMNYKREFDAVEYLMNRYATVWRALQ